MDRSVVAGRTIARVTPSTNQPAPLLLATANPHKVEELRALLPPLLRLLSLRDLGETPPEPAETGATFLENASIKATAYARATGYWCLADDSGLEVDALHGAPGVISSHYATSGVETGLSRAQRDEANNRHLLESLRDVEPSRRIARFVCVLVVASPSGEVRATSRGTLEGAIGRPPRVPAGAHGFGYDPLFLVAPSYERTGAELLPDEKNLLSHRARAAQTIAPQLVELLTTR
jgi:XTP/dITP diphosphohydrolase